MIEESGHSQQGNIEVTGDAMDLIQKKYSTDQGNNWLDSGWAAVTTHGTYSVSGNILTIMVAGNEYGVFTKQ